MLVAEAVDEYRYSILQLSEATQLWYMARLKRFAVWCEDDRLQLQQIKPIHVAKYLTHLQSQPHQRTGDELSSYTVHGFARSIRTFLAWCGSEPQSYIPISIAQNLVMPRLDETVIEIFEPIEIKQLFVATEQEYSPALVARDKAILAVLIDTGIRAGELIGLTLDCVFLASPKDAYIKVTGKGRREREVPLGTTSLKHLYKYIRHYRQADTVEQHVFLSRFREPLTNSGLNRMLYRLAKWAKIQDCHAHKFRHTYAINFLLQGGDVYVLSRLMGHSSVQVTEMYLRALKAFQARLMSKSVLDNL